MARPRKKGIDYFPLDCDFLEDIKIRRILRHCGPSSIAVIIKILSNIYRDEGYYMHWSEDVKFLISDDLNLGGNYIDETLEKALDVNFFDEKMFEEYGILTSKGIQERYLIAVAKRVGPFLKPEFALVIEDGTGVSGPETKISGEETPVKGSGSTQSIVKESKGKYSRETKKKLGALFGVESDSQSINKVMNNFKEEDWPRLVEEVEKSSWLKEHLDLDRDHTKAFTEKILSGHYRDWGKPNGASEDKRLGNSRAKEYSDQDLDDIAGQKWKNFMADTN